MTRKLVAYKSYSFRTKDPIIDALRTAVQDSGHTETQIDEASRVSRATRYNWFYGKTRRPQFATVSAVAIAVGATGIEYRNGEPRFIIAFPKSKLKLVSK